MPKLYFKYGTMGSSKTAQALMVKFNYEERGFKVALLKPSIDTRDGADLVKSRIGLVGKAVVVTPEKDLIEWFEENQEFQVIIVDEAQFLSEKQVEDLKKISIIHVPVICFGLKIDFRTKMFEGSKRLFELSNSITEIKSVCKCGRKADVNARIIDGKIVKEGEQVVLGGNDLYTGMCYTCWEKGEVYETESKNEKD